MKKTVRAALAAILVLSLLSACAGGTPAPQKQVDLSSFAKTLQEKYEFASYLVEMTPEYEYYEEDMERAFPALLEMDLEQQVVLMTLININNGEIDLVQTKSAEDAEKVKELFQARIDYMAWDGENPGGAFYPGPTQLWLNNSRVVSNGNYVMLVCGEECDQIVDDFNALFE